MDILLIDDEVSLRRTLRTTLESMGHTAAEASSGEQALRLLQKQRFEAAFLDLRLGREAGLDLLPSLLREAPDLAVVVVTAYATIASAVEAMRRGAFDYLPKPFTPDQLRVTLERWRQMRRLRNQVADLQEQVRAATPDADLETVEPAMRQALDLAFQAAASEATVLLRGESGTGKGVLARAMHSRSLRSGGPFVTVHCPSLSAELLESELFGHVKGAFTGAVLDTTGKAAAAESGTLFLDEIGDLPLAMQSKLLRAIQERQVRSLGSTQEDSVDVRIVSATHKDLAADVHAGRFRQDLYYRLNVIEILVPPLRERRDDLPALCEALLARIAQESGMPLPVLSSSVVEQLCAHPLGGNVRELENLLHRAVAMSDGDELQVDFAPTQVAPLVLQEPALAPAVPDTTVTADMPLDLQAYLDQREREILVRALHESGFNRTAAAQRLGLSLRQIRYRIARLAIAAPGGDEPNDGGA
jgi:two-component system, NtrC family, response regulator PilR